MGVGESLAAASLFYRHVVFRAPMPMAPDKEAQERVIRESELDGTLVRPPQFVGGRPRGSVRVIEEAERGRLGRVVRRDLARFLVACLSENRYIRAAVAVAS